MKLTIESTGLTPVVNGVPVRLWSGQTEKGLRCVVMVHRVMAEVGRDEELAAELAEMAAPSESSHGDLPPMLAGFCEGLAHSDRYDFRPHDRIMLLKAAEAIALSVGLVEHAERCRARAADWACQAYGPGPGRDS